MLCIAVFVRLCVCMCVLVMAVSRAKTTEVIEIPFGMWTRGGPINRVLEGSMFSKGEAMRPDATTTVAACYTISVCL